MSPRLKLAMAAVALVGAAQAGAQATLYEHEYYDGYSLTAQRRIGNLAEFGFNDRASSLIIERDRWEVCEDARFSGRCVVLGPGRYPSLASMGLNDTVSSLRMVDVAARYDDPDRYPSYYRRDGERLYSANVTSVRAVVGPPEQRCWVEREQVPQRNQAPGAIAGALIGGVLGHQIGDGTGRDVATALGAIGGAVAGANISSRIVSRDVERCVNVSGRERPAYWDVTYVFRGQEHRVQTTEPPGTTITVNALGEPRIG